jgi:hypothetical protein
MAKGRGCGNKRVYKSIIIRSWTVDRAIAYTSFGLEETGDQYQGAKQDRRPGSFTGINNACKDKECAYTPTQHPAEPDDQFFIFFNFVGYCFHALKVGNVI